MKKKFLGILMAATIFANGSSVSAMGIEVLAGNVKNKEKDGSLFYSSMEEIDPDFDYISYKKVRDVKEGDTVITICLLDKFNETQCRTDFVIKKGGKNGQN